MTEEDRDCVTDYAKLGQESWGSEPSIVAVTVGRINSLPAAVHLHTPSLASGTWDVPHIQGACTHPLARARGQWNVQHEQRYHGNFRLPPFLKSPAGCAVQGPPNMKHHPSYTRSVRVLSPETPPNPTALFSCPKQNILPPPCGSSPAIPHLGWLQNGDAFHLNLPSSLFQL